ncbi:heterokaryon incompatibility protein-domain-containing protein [Fusarium solani]|uniref:Heterokaryon incompatibility protein-domain-containing protein n=1 Tax=Fusarium solani TaxID=169388 RepID=A0A9P9FXL0_FUSSL|nr:heterokaryon incompatibility protein-domain-containing protein [Fusarium solani]KAH7227243.1 heterokaryon incompatibility protein-domain-containing protein [Fusarium solani]
MLFCGIYRESSKEIPIATISCSISNSEENHAGYVRSTWLLTLVVPGDVVVILLLTMVIFGDIDGCNSCCPDEIDVVLVDIDALNADIDDQIQLADQQWTYPPPDTYSKNWPRFLLRLELFDEASSQLCDRCLNIDLNITLASLHDPKDGCALCQLLSTYLNKDDIKEPEMRLLDSRACVRICAVPGWCRDASLQPGLPGFLKSGSPSYFRLIREWLRLCDNGECSRSGGCCPRPIGAPMPTRLIDVRKHEVGSDTVRLILADEMGQGLRYVALSHCWGKPTKEQKDHWCTTRSNLEARTHGFLVEQLPATFQDAVRVTRELRQPYLWIDSLCIIQGDDKDWETEAKNMETVFRNAYCTIAATSAEDSTKGFLNRPVEQSDLQYVTVPNSSHGRVYVCASLDDFSGDVEKGILNTRAWVLQERALSHRTIHFTKRQTYWECGGGVRCETLTYMRRANFFSLEFPQSLFAKYSNLGLTKETDRPVAIHSLLMALAKAYNTQVIHGIFEVDWRTSLMWQRSQNPMKRISFGSSQPPPSWSWMAYDGQIKYPKIEDIGWTSIDWDRSFMLAWNWENNCHVLKAQVKRLQDCEVKHEGLEHIIQDENGDEVAHLWFDQEKRALIGVCQFATEPGATTVIDSG